MGRFTEVRGLRQMILFFFNGLRLIKLRPPPSLPLIGQRILQQITSCKYLYLKNLTPNHVLSYSFASPSLWQFLLHQRQVVLRPILSILKPQIHSKCWLQTYRYYFCHAFLEEDTSKTVEWKIFIIFQLILKFFNQKRFSFFFCCF